jgi:hypothetical protein
MEYRRLSPIKTLIESRSRDLGLSRQDIVQRAGYRNLAKGCRRLDELLAGDVNAARGLIDRLPTALDVPTEIIHEAIAETARQQREAEDAVYRAAFKPKGFIITEHTVPTSITMAAFVGADQSLWVDFEPGSTSISFLKQALRAAKQRSLIPFFGNAIGVVINYSPDDALRFDMQGIPVEILPTVHQGETLSVSIRGRVVSSKTLAAIFSGRNDSKGA